MRERSAVSLSLFLVWVVLLPVASSSVHAYHAGNARVRLLTASDQELVLEVHGGAGAADSTTLIAFAVPPEASVHTEVLNTETSSGRVATPPALHVLGPFQYRYQRVCAVRISLFADGTAGDTQVPLAAARIRIGFTGGKPGRGSFIPDPLFEGVLRSTLVNYVQGQEWRTSRTPEPSAQHSRLSPRDLETVLIGVAIDGWLRVTKEDLRATGLTTASIDPAAYRLFQGETELPLLVNSDTSISFFGVRHRGGPDDPEPLTDTTWYRLVWNGGPGMRYAVTAPLPGATDTATWTTATVTADSNRGYFAGTTELEVIDNDPVPGEGWYWERVFPGMNVDLPIRLPPVATSAGDAATIAIRLVSMTADSPGVDHRVQLRVNDSLVAAGEFEGRMITTLTATIPPSRLRSPVNTIGIFSEPTGTTPNLFAVERISVTFPRRLEAVEDLLIADGSPSPSGLAQVFRATGFRDSALRILDPVNGRLLLPLRIESGAGGLHTVYWTDTLSAPRMYCAVSAAGSLRPGALRRKVLTDPSAFPGGADLIIITHRSLMTAAHRLAAHRRLTTGIRTAVLDVEDIYHIFAGGVPDPRAIRELLRTARSSWTPPAPGALLLFGDASWDPRAFLPTTRRADLVPAYGFPAGDAWYGILDTTGIPILHIGRVPAADSVQAAAVVDKLLRYDGVRPDEWVKRFLFITGGTTPAERTTYRTRSEALIRDHVLTDPVAGDAIRAYNTSDAVFDTGLRDTIGQEFARGLLFLNYLGHSTARSWGVDIGSPAGLGTGAGRTPFVASVSCNIGAFAEPSGNVFAEDLLLAENRGAVAVWSSSSLGYPTPGTQLVRAFLAGVAGDSLRGLGELTTSALLRLWLSDPSDPVVRAMVRLNPLLGDPMTRLALPTVPDFSVSAEDIGTTTPGSVATGARTARLSAVLRNHGTVSAESVLARIEITGSRGVSVRTVAARLPLRRGDTLNVEWETGTVPEQYAARITLDPGNRIAEADESNNTVSTTLRVGAPGLLPLFPLRDQAVAPGPVSLVAALPPAEDMASPPVMFEIDTSAGFDSPALVRSGAVSPGPASAEWTAPPVEEGRMYFWRARMDEGPAPGAWTGGSFTCSAPVPLSPMVRIGQHHPSQFAASALHGLLATDSGLVLSGRAPVDLRARSFGLRSDPSAGRYSSLRFGSQAILGQWWLLGGSFLVGRVDERGGSVEFRAFDCQADPAQADSMRLFLDRAPAGSWVAAASILDGRSNVTEGLVLLLEQLGSRSIRNLLPGDSWAFVARKGDPATAAEQHTTDSAHAVISVVPVPEVLSGYMAVPAISLPSRWRSLRWNVADTLSGGDVVMMLRALVHGAPPETLALFRGGAGDVPLVFLDTLRRRRDIAGVEPLVVLTAGPGLHSPRFVSWSLDFAPPPELVVRAGVSAGDRSVAGTFPVEATVYNLGSADADSVRVLVTGSGIPGEFRPLAAAATGPLRGGSHMPVRLGLPLPDIRTSRLYLFVEPVLPGSDLLAGNNVQDLRVGEIGSVRHPFRVLADGAPIMDGDIVASGPVLTVELPGWYEGQRILGVECSVDGVRVDPSAGVQPSPLPAGAVPEFRPSLPGGGHLLEMSLVKENSAGGVDTLLRSVRVSVDARLRVTDFYNFPNPFAGATTFTFAVAGGSAPEEVVLSVFTVRGRKIWERILRSGELRIGINAVEWDGRDADGDEVANGTYLTQVNVRAPGGNAVTARQKLVRVR